MNRKQWDRMQSGRGFVAALDQSGGSTPKALLQYGVSEDSYKNEDEMFAQIHKMRTRIMLSPAFAPDTILAAILFKNTMDRSVEDLPTSRYLWETKGIVPILKVDEGLAELEDGVQLMKPFTLPDGLLTKAVGLQVFGTKMRSVIHEANPVGIRRIVAQQFELGKRIFDTGLVPILEPEVDIHSADKAEAETLLLREVMEHLATTDTHEKMMFKFTIPSKPDFYRDLMDDPHVVRIVALSGGYSPSEANEKLRENHGLIASFSRVLLQGLSADQTDEQFNATLSNSIRAIYEASIT